MAEEITEGCVICRTDGQVSTTIEGETVILDLDSGTYFGLEGVGNRIWKLLENEYTLKEIHQTITAEFDVDADEARKDIEEFLDELHREDLIRIHDT